MKIWFSGLFGILCLFSLLVRASAVDAAYSLSAITTAQSGPSKPLAAYYCTLMDLTGQHVFAAGSNSTAGPYAYISNDYGQNYTQLTNTPNDQYDSCAGNSDLTIIYIVGDSNMYKVTGGHVNATWTVLSTPFTFSGGVATDIDTGTFVVALYGYSRGIAYSTDGGTQWSTSALRDEFVWIAASASGNIFHVVTGSGNYGNYFSLDHGETWTNGDLLPGPYWSSVSCNAAGTVVVAVSSNAYLSINSGVNWNILEGLAFSSWNTVVISPNTNSNSQYIMIASDDFGKTFVSNNTGQSWNQVQSLTGQGICLALSSDGSYSVLGGEGYMWYGNNYGENWCISEAGVTCDLVYGPTQSPTTIPTESPTVAATAFPSAIPTAFPSAVPTASPSAISTASPSAIPSFIISYLPSSQPSNHPTSYPSLSTQKKDHSASLTDGQVAGIITGAVFGSLLVLTLIYFFFRKNRSKIVVEKHDPSKSRSYEAVVVKVDRPLRYSEEAAIITAGGEDDRGQNTQDV